ncbi:hypothetical protein Tco_0861150 [Tanacetum coccineum]|uniref:Uncharacterized protein n=1 Tax=Tanacetum coccineum TaxID=301880 RepID=A0ABQ5BHT7_9ASTR
MTTTNNNGMERTQDPQSYQLHIRLGNQDKILKSILISSLPNDSMKSEIQCLLGTQSLKTTTNVQDDTRKSQEYLSNLTIEFNDKALLAGHRRFFEIYGTIVATKHHEKGLDVGSYDWDEEKLSSED